MLPRLFRCLSASGLIALLTACAGPSDLAPSTAARLAALTDADLVLLGEQHDADDHQRIEREVVEQLAAAHRLAALALEMAEQGRSTAGLPPNAGEADVRQALAWNDRAWPWSRYGPAAMAAVRAGVPVIGANLPRARMREAMADAALDGQLPGPALKAQQQAIRIGHCDLLPESQITPMTRVQIARDLAMARSASEAVRPGRVVVLVAGAGHVDRALGVPRHLAPALRVQAVKLQAGETPDRSGRYDAVWTTPALPPRDACADVHPAPRPRD